jgi:hypothetical protein
MDTKVPANSSPSSQVPGSQALLGNQKASSSSLLYFGKLELYLATNSIRWLMIMGLLLQLKQQRLIATTANL